MRLNEWEDAGRGGIQEPASEAEAMSAKAGVAHSLCQASATKVEPAAHAVKEY